MVYRGVPRRVVLARRRLRYRNAHLPPPPPSRPKGSVTAPPDFVGVGAMKAGTSWWHRLITLHPGVHKPSGRAKELHFFDRFWSESATDAALDAYATYFPRPPGAQAGEWTPTYMSSFWITRLLHRAAPQAKVLVMLRDPIERYRSGIAHVEGRGTRMVPAVPTEHFALGLYHAHLTQVLRCFARERLLLLQYERCLLEPLAQLRRTYEFLGLAPVDFVPEDLDRPINATKAGKEPLADRVVDDLRLAYREPTMALAADFPEIDLGLWPSVTVEPRRTR